MTTLTLRDLGFIGGLTELWTPARITTALWLDAADANTITLNSSTVSQWNDKSGNGRHVSQATASLRPIDSATGFNSMPTLQFTETNQQVLFTSGSAGFNSSTDYFISAVFEAFQQNRHYEMIAGFRPAANAVLQGAPVLQYLGFDSQIGLHNTDVAVTSIKVDLTTRIAKRIATVGRTGGTSGNGGSVTVTSTGNSQASYSTTATQSWNSTTTTGFQIGGRQQAGADFGNKNICEIIGCSANPSTDDRQRIEGYLAHKWGLTANLPSDHPYKSTAPT
jgi:hypothetical protein